MSSELYQACASGDIPLVRTLLSTSPSISALNHLESNGSTVLHLACWLGNRDMVRMLLHECHINRHQRDSNGQTAYDIASEDIRQLFRRPATDGNPFSTDEHAVNPMEIIDDSSHWLKDYPSEAAINTEAFHDVLDEHTNATKNFFFAIASLFGYDRAKNQLDKWAKNFRSILDDFYTPGHASRAEVLKLFGGFLQTENIEALFTLYTLDQSFCQYLARDIRRTHCFLVPIKSSLHCVEPRAYHGQSYRGLSMNIDAFAPYQRSSESGGKKFVGTKTICSTSADRIVAVKFAGVDQKDDGLLHVLLICNFSQRCTTAISLYADGHDQARVSHYGDEQEVLVLPGTIFSVKQIKQCPETRLIEIYLEHYDTDEIKSEVAQDRLQSYIDTILLD